VGLLNYQLKKKLFFDKTKQFGWFKATLRYRPARLDLHESNIIG
jgi:hypothetical protein